MMLGLPVFSGQGFGLGVAVVLNRSAESLTRAWEASARWVGLACSAAGGTLTLAAGRVLVFLAPNALDSDRVAQGLALAVF